MKDEELLKAIMGIGFSVVLMMIVLFGYLEMKGCRNNANRYQWNNGICPKCEVRYELRGVSYNDKYYVCPECGDEIIRY